ncbi:MAG: hypothetical protein HYX87_06965 [Chloroflexi bacterium]|nr:hypothetical protein [Chloroflexota bacterium]
MSDILDEASALVQCKNCSWYKACVLPMRFSLEDVRKQLESGMPGGLGADISQSASSHILAGMVSAAQNTLLEGCPVFVNRLKANAHLAERIKKMMQEWAAEGENPPSH